MTATIKGGSFDDTDKEIAAHLIEKFWILRDREPELYQQIREREQSLRDYFFDKCGFYLIVHRAFAKLEKIPDIPQSWMGFQEFEHPREYALLCCLLAYIEGKSVDEQFLLSDLCETLPALYPASTKEEGGVDWERYEWRRSLVRVLTFACEMGLLIMIDGEIGGFSGNQGSEVLFEVPVISRYFLRSYPKDLFQYATYKELLAAETAEEDMQLTGRGRRYRVYRQLLLTPAFERVEAKEEDFLYLRNLRNRLREDIEGHTPYKFELYNHLAMLVLHDKRMFANTFPDQRGITDIVLHFAAYVRQQVRDGKASLSPEGTLALTLVEFETWLAACKDQTGHGWSKEYRDLPLAKLRDALLQEMTAWKMARPDRDMGMIVLTALVGRTMGAYPRDYMQGENTVHDA